MQLIVTTRALRYAGKEYVRGESFEASDKDAKLLKAVRKAEDAPPPKPVRQVVTTRAIEVEAAPKPEFAPTAPIGALGTADAPIQRSNYRNRRLQAED